MVIIITVVVDCPECPQTALKHSLGLCLVLVHADNTFVYDDPFPHQLGHWVSFVIIVLHNGSCLLDGPHGVYLMLPALSCCSQRVKRR